ncbi:MAG: glycosyltransferase [Ginsengibacter sp.]
MTEQKKAKYSIILPVRNGGEFVKLCINSILSQTIQDFNLIVLDNCSEDGTLEYIQSLADDRILIYTSSKPLTIEENWGRIRGLNTNEFITMIGHDDILFPGYLAEMEKMISSYPQASLYQTQYTYINGKGAVIRKCKPMPAIEDGPSFLKSCLQFKIDVMGTGFMMRAADYKRLGGIQEYPSLIFSDLELWLKLTNINFKATSAGDFFSYRVHQSTTLLTSNLKFLQAFERFVYFLASLKQQDMRFSDLIPTYGRNFLLYYCKAISRRLLNAPKNKNDGLSIKLLIQKFKGYADVLECGVNFEPTSFPTIFIAKILDSNAVGRLMFLIFDKIYTKVVVK